MNIYPFCSDENVGARRFLGIDIGRFYTPQCAKA